MDKSTSFLSEYSIGLSIVPIMKEILHAEYKFVTPIFPWMTREGSNISKYLHKDDQFKIFGVYPRRPKLKFGSENIEIKINQQIFTAASKGFELGIPIIAGCPLVRNFWNLSDNPNYIWIKLHLATHDDVLIDVAKGGNCYQNYPVIL